MALSTVGCVAVGCGSGSGRISKAQYIARAEAICSALEVKTRALEKEQKTLRLAIEAISRARERSQKELEAIPKPSSDPRPAEWLTARERATAASDRTLRAPAGSVENLASGAAEHVEQEKARSIATAYGLTVCARV